jgi:hypothetical protein
LAKINLEEAKKALKNAKQMNEKLIVSGESAKTEVEYYLAAGETAIAKAIDGNSPELPSLESNKSKLLSKMEELNAGKLKIRELNYLP